MSSTEILDEKLIFLDLVAKNKNEAICLMADLLEEQGILSDKGQFIIDVYKREASGITGIGDGFAIPHGISQGVKKNAIAIGVLHNTIAWESIDDEQIKVIVMFAVAANANYANKYHLKMMAEIATVLAHEEKKKRLKAVTTSKEAIAIFAEGRGST